MTCAICGAALNPGAMFCGECGSRVTPGSVVPQPVQQPQPSPLPAQYPPTVQPTVPVAALPPGPVVALPPGPVAPIAAEVELPAQVRSTAHVSALAAGLETSVPDPLPEPVAPAAFEPLNDDFDETVISPRAPVLTITGPDGIPHVIRGATVIGRAPRRPADRPDVEVLALADLSKSLSKSHAIVTPQGEEIVIEDIGSTNGVIIKHSDGRETVLPAHRSFPLAVGTVLELGDYVLTIGRR